jgi:hypothetical protein
MTPEDIDNMQAGRELDALVAQNLMNWRVTQACGVYAVCFGDSIAQLPYFSTDIKDAWLVVDKLRELGLPVHIQVTQHQYGVVGYRDILNDDWMWADTAPLAICRAALMALSKPQQPTALNELFHNSLTSRGKQALANEAIDDFDNQQPAVSNEMNQHKPRKSYRERMVRLRSHGKCTCNNRQQGEVVGYKTVSGHPYVQDYQANVYRCKSCGDLYDDASPIA